MSWKALYERGSGSIYSGEGMNWQDEPETQKQNIKAGWLCVDRKRRSWRTQAREGATDRTEAASNANIEVNILKKHKLWLTMKEYR